MGEHIELGATIGNPLVVRVTEDVDPFVKGELIDQSVDSLEVTAPHGCDWLLKFAVCSELPPEGTVAHAEQVKDCVVRQVRIPSVVCSDKEVVFVIRRHDTLKYDDLFASNQVDPV